MIRRLFLALLILLCVLPGYSGAVVARNLAPGEARAMLTQRSDLYLLDVRTPAEFRQLRIEGAHLIPIDQFVRRLAEIPKDRPILVYCAVGSRSAQVVNFLARQGFPEIYNLAGGVYSWAQQGYPVLQGDP